MVELISTILTEYEPVPFILLELLFARIIDPEKVTLRRFSDGFLFTRDLSSVEITWRMLRIGWIDHSSRRIVSETSDHRSASLSDESRWLIVRRFFSVFQSCFNQRRYGRVAFAWKNLLHFRRVVSHFRHDRRGTDSNDWTSFNRTERTSIKTVNAVFLCSRLPMRSIVVMRQRSSPTWPVQRRMISRHDTKVSGDSFSKSKKTSPTHRRTKISFRFKNGVPEIQLTCLKCLKSYFTNHPELQEDLEGERRSSPVDRFFHFELSRCDGSFEFINRYERSSSTDDTDSSDHQRQPTRHQRQTQTNSLRTCQRQNRKWSRSVRRWRRRRRNFCSSGKCERKHWIIWVMSTRKNVWVAIGRMKRRKSWLGLPIVSFIFTIKRLLKISKNDWTS